MAKAVASEQARAFIVMNPVAGQVTPDALRAVLAATFGAHGWHYDIYETRADDQTIAAIQEAREGGCDLMIAAGGDGTISLVADHLAGSEIPIGILPVGTANVLAHELGIPADVEQAAALLVGEHRLRELDMMQVGERHFILQIGIGLDSLMIKDTARQAKRLFGRLAYMGTLVGKLFGYQSQRFTMLVDGERMRPRAWQVLVANAGTLGVAPFRWGPNIHPDDGELDLCIFHVRMPSDYVRLLWQLVSGHQSSGSNITYKRIQRQIIITTDRPLPVQADGEIIGETPVQINVIPRGVRVIVPPEEEGVEGNALHK